MPTKDGFSSALLCIPAVVLMKLEIVNDGTFHNPRIAVLYPGIPTTSSMSINGWWVPANFIIDLCSQIQLITSGHQPPNPI